MQTKRYKIFYILIIVVALVAISLGSYFYYKLNKIENSSGVKVQKELDNLLSKVSEHYFIPFGEEPTIATVSDPERLSDQAFFTKAEKGDKVLIFIRLGKAVLYRPNIDKIIDITSIKNTLEY